jgi:hypothetical protein
MISAFICWETSGTGTFSVILSAVVRLARVIAVDAPL